MTKAPAIIAASLFGALRVWRTAACRVLVVCALTVLAAQVSLPVPGSSVPMTLQLLIVLGAGMCLPAGEAVAAMVLYLLAGMAGLPVHAPGSLGVFGPTGGYLVGFVLAAAIMPRLCRSRSLAELITAGVVGAGSILGFGTMWLVIWLGGDLRAAVATGLLPFAPKAAIELALAVGLVRMFESCRGPGKK